MDECVSPAPNFSFGFIALAMCIIVTLSHLMRGRYHDIAFIRKERIVKTIAQTSSEINKTIKKYAKYKFICELEKEIEKEIEIEIDK